MLLISYIAAVFFVLAVLADRLPLIKFISEISTLGKRSLKTIKSEVMDDAEKQKFLLANAAGIFKHSAKLAGLLILILLAGYLLVLTGDFLGIFKASVLFAHVDTVTGIVISVLAFCFYFLLKKIYARARR